MEPLPMVAELHATLEHHTEAVSSIFPYGPHWLSCSWDGQVVLWKPKPPFEVHEVLPADTRPLACACEVGGKTIVRGNVDGVVEAWELVPIPPPPEPEAPPPPPPDPKAKKPPPAKAAPPPPPPEPLPEEWKAVRSVRPEIGRTTTMLHVPGRLLVAYATGNVCVFDLENWNCVGRLEHPTGVTALLHFESNLVVSGCTDRRARIWDVSTLACICTLPVHQSAVTCLLRSGNGWLLTGAADGTVCVWDVIRPPPPDPPPPEPEPPPDPEPPSQLKQTKGKHGAQAKEAPPPTPPPAPPPPPPPPISEEADDGAPPREPPPPLGTEWEKVGEFSTGTNALRSMLWSSGVLVCGDSQATLTVWNHRPIRADEPENRLWVQERSTLGGMGSGPIACLAKIGKRMFAGGADGRIRVYM